MAVVFVLKGEQRRAVTRIFRSRPSHSFNRYNYAVEETECVIRIE
jgi:hypothetical protein